MIDYEADLIVVTDGVSLAKIDYVDACHNIVAQGVGEVVEDGKRNAARALFINYLAAVEAFDVAKLYEGVLPWGNDCRISEDSIGTG